MTAAAPPSDANDDVDYATLVRVDASALRLKREGKLDEERFRAFWREAREACAGQLQLLDTLRLVAEPGWVR